MYWTGVHIGATWRIRLNGPCAAAMRPYVKVLNNGIRQTVLATRARCGGVFNIHLTANLPRNLLPVKFFSIG